jgi:hypothetical protein
VVWNEGRNSKYFKSQEVGLDINIREENHINFVSKLKHLGATK